MSLNPGRFFLRLNRLPSPTLPAARTGPDRKRRRVGFSRGGFSFLEIMVVVVIIGLLAAIVMPRMAGRLTDAKVRMTRGQIAAVETALGDYELTIGDFPTSEQGLKALVVRPAGVPEEDWPQFMKQLPLDKWQRPFLYRCPGEDGRDYDIVSFGKDGVEGTDDDITNIPPEIE